MMTMPADIKFLIWIVAAALLFRFRARDMMPKPLHM
jgi:hypothetical protein